MIAIAAIIAALVVDAATKESGQLAYELKRDTGLPWGQLREPTGLKVPQGRGPEVREAPRLAVAARDGEGLQLQGGGGL